MCNAAAGAVTLKSSKKDHSCVRWRTDDLGRWGDGSRARRTAAYARRCGSEGQVAAIQKSFADCVCDAQIPPAIAVVDGDGRHIDLVVIFLHELDVGRKLDRSRRPQRQSEAPKQFFLFAVRKILRGGHVFELLLDGRGRVREHLRLRIDRRHHQGNTGGDRFILGKILETVLFGDRLELGLVSGIGTTRKYGAWHHLFHYRRHVLLGGDESLDVLLRQLNLRYRDPRRCVGREVSENNGHNHTGETKHLIHGGAPHLCPPAPASG